MKTAKCHLRRDKADKEGRCPVMLIVTYRRKQSRVSLGFRLHPDDFDEQRGKVRRHVEGYEALNERITQAIAHQLAGSSVDQIVESETKRRKQEEDAYQRGKFIMPENLPVDQQEFLEQLQSAGRMAKKQQVEQEALAIQKEKVFADFIRQQNQPHSAQTVTLHKCFEDHVTKLKAEGSIGTSQSYNASLTKLKAFGPDLPMNEIDVQWIKRLDQHWIAEGLKINTRHRHHKNVRALLNSLVREDAIVKNPYALFRVKTEGVVKKFLSEAQLAELEALELTGLKQQHKLMFLWALYSGGCRVRDCLDLRWSAIRDGRLHLKTIKTGSEVNFKLVPKALAILDYFRQLNPNPPKKDDHVFPFMAGSKALAKEAYYKKLGSVAALVNKNLALISKKLNGGEGLGHSMNFKTARVTFATISISRGAKVQYVSQLMGHRDLRVTMKHYASLLDKDLDRELDSVFGD